MKQYKSIDKAALLLNKSRSVPIFKNTEVSQMNPSHIPINSIINISNLKKIPEDKSKVIKKDFVSMNKKVNIFTKSSKVRIILALR